MMSVDATNPVIGHSNRRVAFTLVELMVVIAIISVLAALLMPAVQSAKNHAKTAACANNQRQIGAAMNAYLNFNNGYYPYQTTLGVVTAGTGGPYPTYLDVLVPYLVGGSYTNFVQYNGATTIIVTNNFQKLIRCPANPSDWTFQYFDTTSYPMNCNLFPPQMQFYAPYGPSPGSPAGWDAQARIGTFNYPAGALMMGECPVNNNTNAVDDPWVNGVGPNSGLLPYWPYASGNFCDTCVTNWDWHNNNQYWGAPDDMAWNWLRTDCTMLGSVFHNLSMNCLYIDGHVAQLSKSTLINYTFQYECPDGTNDVIVFGGWGGGTAAEGIKNNSTGGIFWNDGQEIGIRWFANQFPGNAPGNATQ